MVRFALVDLVCMLGLLDLVWSIVFGLVGYVGHC